MVRENGGYRIRMRLRRWSISIGGRESGKPRWVRSVWLRANARIWGRATSGAIRGGAPKLWWPYTDPTALFGNRRSTSRKSPQQRRTQRRDGAWLPNHATLDGCKYRTPPARPVIIRSAHNRQR